jgi:nucleoside-triphosphatase THEP1
MGLSVAGLLTTRRVASGHLGLDVEDLSSGERVPLAERDQAADGPVTGHWTFHRHGIEWGATRLARAGAADLFVVDEIGPLELLRDEGWVGAISALANPEHRLAVAVVRPELVTRLVTVLGDRPVRRVDVSPANRDALPDELAVLLTEPR